MWKLPNNDFQNLFLSSSIAGVIKWAKEWEMLELQHTRNAYKILDYNPAWEQIPLDPQAFMMITSKGVKFGRISISLGYDEMADFWHRGDYSFFYEYHIMTFRGQLS
jgi:hypothetical protein